MKYSLVAEAYGRLDAISGRNEMTEILAALLEKTPRADLPTLAYLTRGKLRPDYEGIEVGLAEKLALKALGTATGLSQDEVYKTYVKLGDIGSAAQELLKKREQGALFSEPLTIMRVYDSLFRISQKAGQGSIDLKLKELGSLLNDASPLEAKYIMRTVTGELRLGVADYTLLDACAVAFLGGKSERTKLERAYNVHPDIGFVVETAAKGGMKGIAAIRVRVGVPIRPMLAERLESARAILDKLGKGEVAAEYKLDGERLQIHKAGERVTLFSRRLEVITSNYPDAVELARKNVKARTAILEAEVVAINEESGEYLPFQELMHRRRKHGVQDAMRAYPVALNFFDLLFVERRDATRDTYKMRRKELERTVNVTDRTNLVPALRTSDPDKIEKFMEDAIADGCEGLVIKDLSADYRAGAREFAWIKLKREYRSELTDTLDLVVIGAFHGKGRRAGAYGTYLLAAFDPDRNLYTSISKVGTGFSDEDLQRLPKLVRGYESPVRPPDVESKMEPDVWFKPHLVLETIASEVTLSPIHTAGFGSIRPGSGIALRFPKFTGRVRDDKSSADATTVGEILKMYRGQVRHLPSKPAGEGI